MNKAFYAGVAVVLIAGFGLWWLYGRDNPSSTTNRVTNNVTTEADDSTTDADNRTDNTGSDTESAPAENVVTYSSSGYSPSSLTIKVGETVTFKNESGSTMWTASDPHPTHTILPAFDADKPIANGDTYQFTFTQAGTWGYHDHNNSARRGTIVVE